MQYNDHLLPYSGSQPMLTGAGSMAALSGIGGGGGGGGAGGPLGGLGLGGWGNGGGMNGGGLNGHASAAAGGQLGGLGLGLGLGGGAGGLGGGGSGFPGNLLAELQAGSAAAAAGGVGPGGGSGPGGGKSAFQPPGNRGPAASPSKAESGTSSLPAGVLPLGGGAGGGGGGNGVPHPIFGFPAVSLGRVWGEFEGWNLRGDLRGGFEARSSREACLYMNQSERGLHARRAEGLWRRRRGCAGSKCTICAVPNAYDCARLVRSLQIHHGNGTNVCHTIHVKSVTCARLVHGLPACLLQEAPALSGISSLGQPPPPADLGSGSSAQRLAALKAGLARVSRV